MTARGRQGSSTCGSRAGTSRIGRCWRRGDDLGGGRLEAPRQRGRRPDRLPHHPVLEAQGLAVKTQITHNTAEMRRRMLARPARVARELRRENVAIAKDLTAASQAILQADVYAIPVKHSPTGRPLWTRTGQLKAEDRW